MSYFEDYKPFLYNQRNEKERKDVGITILKYLMTISEIDRSLDSNLTPNEIVGFFEEKDINWVVELLKDALENHFDYNYTENTEERDKVLPIVNKILAFISSDCILKDIYNTNKDKSQEVLFSIPDEYKKGGYFYANIIEGVENCVSLLSNVYFSFSPFDINSNDILSNFNNLVKLYDFLSSFETVSEEVMRRNRLMVTTEGMRKTFVTTMMDTLVLLYQTGFSGFPEEGVMVENGNNSPLLHIDYRTNKVVYKKADAGLINDYNINKAILDTVHSLKNLYITREEEEEPIPDIAYFIDNMYTPFVCYELHLQLQSANVRYSKGKASIANWIKETKRMSVDEWIAKENNGKTVIQKWSEVKKWYEWALDTIFVNALMEYGDENQKLNGSLKESNTYFLISNALISSLKNIIVVAERDNKKFSNIDIRISSSSELSYESIEGSIKRALNFNGTSIVKCVEKSKNDKNVIFVNVIFDEKEATKGNLFAGDVIDKFIESGNRPSWSHALIGKKEDGSLFFWDKFMDPNSAGPESRCYTIYAASRSGKGTMTSTLVASALADGRQVFYTDGKPENGPVMGMVAWEKGKEAYVFDGKPKGMDPFSGYMEGYTNGLRTEGEIAKYLYELPKSLFEFQGFNEETHLKFLGLMRYLKSLNLCAEILRARAQGGEEGLPKDNWQIWIFDEMTSMSSNEKDIRVLFGKYCSAKGVPFTSKTISKSKEASERILLGIDIKSLKPEIINPNSPSYDAGIDYIAKWCNWCNQLLGKIGEANVISLGKADANLIFIFQQPDWLRGHGSLTTIGKIVNALHSTKIVGRGGIVAESGEYGDDTLKNKDWKKKIDIEGAGNWAMSSGRDIRTSSVTLFKPFNIWTVPLNNGKMSTEPLSEEDAGHYFKGYVSKLLGFFGEDPAEIIESSYLYADNAVKQLNLLVGENRNNIRDYLYDCTNLDLDKKISLKDVFNDITGVKQREMGSIRVSEELDVPEVDVENTVTPTFEAVEDGDGGIVNVEVSKIGDVLVDKELERLEKQKDILLQKYKAKYNEVIDTIKRDKDKLFGIPNEEKNRVKFNSLKNDILRKFDSTYIIKKENFLDEIEKEVKNVELLTIVKEYYNTLFENEFKSLKDEIVNKELEVDSVNDNVVSNDSIVDETSGGAIGDTFVSQQDTTRDLRAETIKQEPKEDISSVVDKSAVHSRIETGDTRFNVENVDDIGNVKASRQITEQIIKDIVLQFGGVNNIDEITITANESLVINGYTYLPEFNDNFYNSLGAAILQDVKQGKIGKVVNLGEVVASINRNIYSLSIESPKIAEGTVFKQELGVYKKGYSYLFRICPNLQTINLPNKEITRDNPNVDEQPGLGSKLANLFGFGRPKEKKAKKGNRNEDYIPDPTPSSKDHQFVDRMFDSRPVRILTGALGWTMGCKAVVMAATLFGPWGLLFGGLAMVGAYGEIKNSKTQQNDYQTKQRGRQDSYNGGFGGQNYQNNGKQTKKSKQNRQGGHGGYGGQGGYRR